MKNNNNNPDSPQSHYLAAADLAGVPGMPGTVFGVIKKSKREQWPSRPRAGRGGGREYPLSCLPVETQAALAAQLVGTAANDDAPATDARAEALSAVFDSKSDVVKAKARAALAAVREYHALRSRGFAHKAVVDAVTREHNLSAATLWRFTSAVKGEPEHTWLFVLCPGYAGRTSQSEMSAEAWETLKADYLRRERPSAMACIQRLKDAAPAKGWSIPSTRTLLRRLEKLPQVMKVMQREGGTAAKALYPAQQRLKAALAALDVINGDGYKHNVWVKFPDGEVIRAKTWFWQDVYSSKIIAWRTDKTEHTDMIRLSFGDLVENYGIPNQVLLDNTLAAANKTMSGGVKHRFRFKVREDEPLGVFAMMNVGVIWATPGHGQAKPIERTFGVGGMGEYIDKAPEFAGAWTGASPLDKPEYDGKSKTVDLADLTRVIAREVAAFNAREGRRGAMHQGRSFDEVWQQSYSVITPRRATEAQRRLWLLATEPIKTSARNGEFALDAGRVVGERVANRYWHADLIDYAGKSIVARFDPARLHEGVHVYQNDGSYICFAECVQAAGFNDQNAGREHSRARNTFTRAIKAAAAAESRMSALDAAKAYAGTEPSTIPSAAAVRGNVVRAEFRDPLERPVPTAPSMTADEGAALEAEIAAVSTRGRVVNLDDPERNYKRWCAIDRRAAIGEPLDTAEAEFHRSYKHSDEWRSMERMAEDFPELKTA
jgi:putative transposase